MVFGEISVLGSEGFSQILEKEGFAQIIKKLNFNQYQGEGL